MIRKYFLIVVFFVFVWLLSGCGAKDSVPNYEENPVTQEINNVLERKIIYKAHAKINTQNLPLAIEIIKENLQDDEWFDEERVSESSAYFVVRVKSARIDNFINAISESGKISNFEKRAIDVSLSYQDTTNQIASYEAERERLVELFEEATISDMIYINTRISQIDKELSVLKGTLAQYDSLIEYSEITLYLYQVGTLDDESFGSKIKNAFFGGWNALITFIKFVIIGVVAIFPFLVLFSVVGLGIYFPAKIYKKRQINKKSNK